MLIEMRYNEIPENTSLLLDISHLEALSFIQEEETYIRIGSGTTHSEIEESSLLRSKIPILADASRQVGSPQIRNRGTIGGNLITAAQCADTIPPLLVLDAEVVLRKSGSERTLKIGDFLTGPKTTSIEENEIMTEIRFMKPPSESKQVFSKLIRREAVAKTRISVAALALQDKSGRIINISLSPGSVTSRPSRFYVVEELMKGKIPTNELIENAAREAAGHMITVSGRRWSTPYKEPVLHTLVKRALNNVLEVINE
jgi:CO/xanthine dehydrogenase FAD-binding subunit